MKTFGKLFKYIFVIVLFISACSVFADTYTYDLSTDPDLYVWDVSGTYSDVSICGISYTIVQDPAGKLTSSGNVSCTVRGYPVTMSFIAKGAITQKNNIPVVKLNIKFTGLITIDAKQVKFKASEKLAATINAINVIEGSVKACISSIGCETVTREFDHPVDMDGSAELVIDVNQIIGTTSLGGTGTLTLSNGDEYDFNAKGSYDAVKGLDKLALAGKGKPSPGKFTIVINDSNDNLNLLKGKSLGQSLKTSDMHAEK
jgi:hypothetical protein